MNSYYYYSEGGETDGPIPWEQLRYRVDNGLVSRTAQVCEEGTDLWLTFDSMDKAKRQQEKVKAAKTPTKPFVQIAPAIPSGPAPILNPVTVTDIRMPFWSMVIFMVKWAFAAIPAAIVLLAVYFVVGLFFALVAKAIAGG